MHGKSAEVAAKVATEQLSKGKSDASAIRIGNAVGDRVLSHEGGGKVAAAKHSDNPTTRKRANLAATMSHFAAGGKVKSFPIPSRPAPSGGEDNQPPKFMGGDEPDTGAYAGGGMIRHASYAGGGAVCNSSMRYAKGG